LEFIIWSSLHSSRNNSYLIHFQASLPHSFPNDYFFILLTISFLLPTHQVTNTNVKKKTNMCLFIVHDIYINSIFFSPIYIISEILQNLSYGFPWTIFKIIIFLIFLLHQHGYEKKN
jgi:hypothetical protein